MMIGKLQDTTHHTYQQKHKQHEACNLDHVLDTRQLTLNVEGYRQWLRTKVDCRINYFRLALSLELGKLLGMITLNIARRQDRG
jgi:hypothetical protein